MEKRRTRKHVPTYSFSSDEEDSNNDDSLFTLEDGLSSGSEEESKSKKKKVNSKSAKSKANPLKKRKTDSRASKTKKASKNLTEDIICCDSAAESAYGDIASEGESSSCPKEVKSAKRAKRKSKNISEASPPKKIKLEPHGHEPDLSKVKVERVSLPTSNETACDRKPNIKNIKSENYDTFDEIGDSALTSNVLIKKEKISPKKTNSSVDHKPDIRRVKLEQNVKSESHQSEETEASTSKNVSKKQRKVKNEIEDVKPIIKSEQDQNAEKAPSKPKTASKKQNALKCEPKQEVWDENISHDPRALFKLGDPNWEYKLLSEKTQLDFRIARAIINMLRNECTIPFIARYRRNQTGGLDADQLRHVKDAYDDIKTLENKAQNVVKKLQKLGAMTEQIERTINAVRSLDELDYVYAPFKPNSSKSKAEKARALGLEEAAYLILNGNKQLIPSVYIDSSKEGLQNNDEVIQNVQNIIADLFSKNDAVLEYLRESEKTLVLAIKSTRTKIPKDREKDESKKKPTGEDAMGKFELYYDFQTTTARIQPHQILALNRGENLKVLSMKFSIPDWLPKRLYSFCERKWLYSGLTYALRTQMFRSSFNDAYTRLISPLLIRRARSNLNQQAQRAAIENFAVNLKNLLQTPPVKGCSILGIDPGFRHGFKFALIDSQGDLVWTSVLHFDVDNKSSAKNQKPMDIVRNRLISHECELIAIGNGTGCRAIEAIISHYISTHFFEPALNLRYTIVNERGASIYSCTTLAKEEFPDLDPNLVSAVFIARSLQDPLNEYVKVEPKHLGVGMYQHDVPEARLNNALEDIVSECVSFTGVDVNTASVHLLKRISGLGVVRANSIIEWRRANGPFKNREQLQLVNRIGQKTFEQCAGFIRVHSQNIDKLKKESEPSKSGVNGDANPLDSTWIHPESYAVTYLFLDKCQIDLFDLGSRNFIDRVNAFVQKEGIEKIAADLNENVDTISLIANALMKPLDYDYRSQFAKPFFKQGLTEMSSLKTGMKLTGVVGNVTNFGAFVDVGVSRNGLIHVSSMKGCVLQVGDRVEVEILSIEIQRGRIGLNLLNVFR